MPNGIVVALFICPTAGERMQPVQEVMAIAGAGLKGDRYANAVGSYNKGRPGKRQVTFINARFFKGTGFAFAEARRNGVISGVELMWLIGKEFSIGEALFLGEKYCDPCKNLSKFFSTKF